MHFFVLGGGGRTGGLLVDQALSQGNTVSLLARDPLKIKARDGVSVVKGDAYNQEDVKDWFAGGKTPDAVLVALGATASDNPFAAYAAPKDMLTKCNAHVVEEMKIRGISKIVVLQAFGAGDSLANLNFLMRLVINNSSLGHAMADHDSTRQMLSKEGADGSLQWVCVRPCMLAEGPTKTVKEFGNDGKGAGWMPSITRASVASFMLEAARKDDWDGQTPVITN